MRPIIPRTDLTPIASLPALYNPRDLALIRRTVANALERWSKSLFEIARPRSA